MHHTVYPSYASLMLRWPMMERPLAKNALPIIRGVDQNSPAVIHQLTNLMAVDFSKKTVIAAIAGR